jgi:hypothetical protein
MKTSEVRELLRKRYPSDAWALMWEVADGTGAAQRRWADAVAMGLWPSRGLHLHGFEIKVSRSDWVKELQSPEKAEAVAQYCDYWWLVVGDNKIVKMGELPPLWGMLAPNSRGDLYVAKPAVKLPAKPITPVFLAALLRSACKPSVKDDQVRITRAVEDQLSRRMEVADRRCETAERRLAELTQQLIEFERFSGLTITDARYRWTQHKARDIGRVVKEVLDGHHDRDRQDMERLLTTAKHVVARLEECLTKEVPHESDRVRTDQGEGASVRDDD